MVQKKGQMVFDTLLPWLIAIAVILIVGGFYLVLSGKGSAMVDYFKQVLRFG